ncbi:MAG: glycosyl transferase [Pseudopedobacter saltans]|uniref:Glycosyl transferase n=1 Tax=Pseudopedobacter saltans TaxID=151895 RepID=A0A2W5H257_9SPHI|nr:MAG: glycosyl transferase [Pseudopedobacter saltans]
MKILIIRFSSIGDIVLTSPVVRCLKKQLPQAEIHYLTKPAFASIVESNPYLSKTKLLDKDWKKMMKDLQTEKYDLIVDLHHNIRTLRIKWGLRSVKSVSFNKLNYEKWLMVRFKVNKLPNLHIVDRYLQAVQYLQVRNDDAGLDFFIKDQERMSISDMLPDSHQSGYIGVVIGASYETKQLPFHKLSELCQKLRGPIVLLGGKEDMENGQKLSALNPEKIFDACGKFSLMESAFLVSKADQVISHDTGLMHIAAAFQKPIISVWGNTIPGFGMYPYYGKSKSQNISFEVDHLPCRPCSKIGFHSCPKKHFRCMEEQDIDAMSAIVNA